MVRGIRGGRRQHQLAIRRDFNVAHAAAGIRDREVAYFGVVLGRHDDPQRRRDSRVGPMKLSAVLGKCRSVAVRLHPTWLVASGPHPAAFHVAQEDVDCPCRPVSRLRASGSRRDHASGCSRSPRPSPSLHSGRWRADAPVALRRSRNAVGARPAPTGPRCAAPPHFLGPRVRHGDVARRALLKQQLGRLDLRLRMKALAHDPVAAGRWRLPPRSCPGGAP